MLFSQLFKKVMAALRLGLPVDKKTLSAVEHVFKRRDISARIAARAMVATLFYTAKDPEAFKKDLGVVELILSQWMRRITEGKDPFYTKTEKGKLVEILQRNNFPNPERFVNHLVVEFGYDTGENFKDVMEEAKRKIDEKVGEREEKKKIKGPKVEEKHDQKKAKVHS